MQHLSPGRALGQGALAECHQRLRRIRLLTKAIQPIARVRILTKVCLIPEPKPYTHHARACPTRIPISHDLSPQCVDALAKADR